MGSAKAPLVLVVRISILNSIRKFANLRVKANRKVRTRVIFYQEADGTVPFLEWYETLPEAVQDKCRIAVERLRESGHQLRRPEADYLRDGIYELRTKRGKGNYRILYFFDGKVAAVVSHGLVKEDRVPPKAIDRARERKLRFQADPSLHTYEQKGA